MGKASVKISTASIITCLLMLTSCNYSIDKSSKNDRQELSPIEKASLSYDVVRSRIFIPRCITCHGSSGRVSLDSFEAIKSHLPAIERTVFVDKSMPKSGSLSDNELAILRAWIDAGAPEKSASPNVPEPTPVPQPVVPLEPKFESIKINIFEKRCTVCHSTGGQASQVSLGTISDLVNSPRDLALPGNPDESGLVLAIERGDSKRMPPAETGDALTPDQIKVIRDWIQNGASD
jgi:mono/diheme cytochrome c family protein